MVKKTAKIPEAKKQVIKDIVKLAKEYPIVGAVNMENLPTKQLQNMRAQLRTKVVLKMTKRRLMKIALEQAAKEKPGVEKLIPYLKGMPALLFTKENPFSLYKTLSKNKSSAPIKAGQKAPNDIVVPAGPTSFAPGPIIGQLGQAGIAAGIEGGKVAIKKDSKVAKEGDTIKPELASILTRLGIEPMEIGLDLTATFEDGNIFTKDVLAVDEKEYIDNITNGHRWAFNLAMEAGILTKETTTLMITKAFNDAKALAIAQDIYADTVMPMLLAKAHNQMLGLKGMVPEG
ncbi:TPA: 50S ribosomal protein L10 [Candidatus Woesearchaeota archaeon]|nr:50S ribosomal protein L10 [Candidatus Woesearchaeota archaeon]